MAPPRWWYARYIRMTRTADYQQGRKLAEYQRRLGENPDGAVKAEQLQTSRERITK